MSAPIYHALFAGGDLTHGELFAGISGFGLGFARAGIPTRWAVEIDPACRSILRRHHPGATVREDVRTAGADNLCPVDVISFGSPCQDLSVAGRRRGLDGERSGLFFEAVRIIGELRPTYAIWENVPGALTSNAGRDFGAVLDALAECGAVDICWRMLDAQYFGLAQRRLRLFLVASFRAGTSAAKVLFEPESGAGHPPARGEAREGTPRGAAAGAGNAGGDMIPALAGPQCASKGGHRQDLDSGGAYIPTIAPALRVPDAKGAPQDVAEPPLIAFTNRGIDGETHETRRAGSHGALPMVAYGLELTNQGSGGNRGWYTHDSPHRTLDTNGPPGVAYGIRGTLTSRSAEKGGPNGTGVLRGAQWTLSATEVHAVAQDMAVRRLTPRECERLQGFPDDWTAYGGDGKPISDSTRYRQLGNAVAVPCAEWIAQRIGEAFLRGVM